MSTSTSSNVIEAIPLGPARSAFHAGYSGYGATLPLYFERFAASEANPSIVMDVGAAALAGVDRFSTEQKVHELISPLGQKLAKYFLRQIEAGQSETVSEKILELTGLVSDEAKDVIIEQLQMHGVVDESLAEKLDLATINGLWAITPAIETERKEETPPENDGPGEELSDEEKEIQRANKAMLEAINLNNLREAFLRHPLVRDPEVQQFFNRVVVSRINGAQKWPVVEGWFAGRLPGGSEEEELTVALARDRKLIDVATLLAETGDYQRMFEFLLTNKLVSVENEMLTEEDDLSGRYSELYAHAMNKQFDAFDG